MPKNIIFMGSPDFALPTLHALLNSDHTITAVYTQPPRPAGRGKKMQPTPVHQLANTYGLPVHTPERLKGEALEILLAQAQQADAIVVVAYGLLLPAALVNQHICLNVHPSALPRWRGAAPLQHTLLAGDTTTEVCIMQLDPGMDTGPVYSRSPLALPPEINLGDLHDITAQIGAEKLLNVVNHLEALSPIPQPTEHATIAPKITKDMRPIRWQQTATEVHNHVRGISPFPAATAVLCGEVCKIYQTRVATSTSATAGPTNTLAEASAPENTTESMAQNPAPKLAPGTVISVAPLCVACQEGALEILELQKPGGTRQTAADFLHGSPLKPGDCLA